MLQYFSEVLRRKEYFSVHSASMNFVAIITLFFGASLEKHAGEDGQTPVGVGSNILGSSAHFQPTFS